MMLRVTEWCEVVSMVEKAEGRIGVGRPAAGGVTPNTFKVLNRFYVPDRDSLPGVGGGAGLSFA